MLLNIFGALLLTISVSLFTDLPEGCEVGYYSEEIVFIGHSCDEVSVEMIRQIEERRW